MTHDVIKGDKKAKAGFKEKKNRVGARITKNPPERRLQASLPVAGQTECPSLK